MVVKLRGLEDHDGPPPQAEKRFSMTTIKTIFPLG